MMFPGFSCRSRLVEMEFAGGALELFQFFGL